MPLKETGTKARSRLRGAAIVGVLALACLASMAYVSVGADSAGDAEGLVAVVHDGDGGVREMPLDRDGTLDVSTSLGCNTIVVEGGRVFVSDADCAGHDCMAQGPASQPNERIVCLPHKLWIEIVDGARQEGRGFDAVSG